MLCVPILLNLQELESYSSQPLIGIGKSTKHNSFPSINELKNDHVSPIPPIR